MMRSSNFLVYQSSLSISFTCINVFISCAEKFILKNIFRRKNPEQIIYKKKKNKQLCNNSVALTYDSYMVRRVRFLPHNENFWASKLVPAARKYINSDFYENTWCVSCLQRGKKILFGGVELSEKLLSFVPMLTLIPMGRMYEALLTLQSRQRGN